MIADIKKLEFDKIKEKCSQYAKTDLGKKYVLDLQAKTNQSMIEKELLEVEQAKIMSIRYDKTPLVGILDIRSIIKKVKIESTLNVEELMKIVSLQEAIGRTDQYVKKIINLDIDMSALEEYYNRIESLALLKKEIDRIIDSKGEIYNNASSDLNRIRRAIKAKEDKINQVMQSVLKSESQKLSDNIITIRNNRLVLPVKSEYKNIFKGVMHDQSASRETVFMEPMACFHMNNDLQSLYVDEESEVEKILKDLTLKVKEYIDDIKLNFEIFTYLDTVFAKASYAIEYDMTRPIIGNDIHLINARHPLIDQNEVVGNHILFNNYRHIIITGPNTGGKTVALKTLGLLSLMVQAGMLIPVNEYSKTVIFNHIFADIGDEQSIEQSLSTFSSHIENIIRIFNHIEDQSLVLLDEIGSGTDPKEGASLAISMLNFLRSHKIYSMVTTHYPELKTYAYNLEDTINASVEFDLDSLQPTYKLRIGTPGESNAISIARRLGLKEEICMEAQNVSLSFDTDVTKLVKKLEKQSLELENQIEEEKQRIKELESEKTLLKEEREKQIHEQNKLLDRLKEENKDKQKDALEKVDLLIAELDDLRQSAKFKEHRLAEIKYERSQLNTYKVTHEKTNDHTIREGDRVKVLNYKRNGVVNKMLKDDEFEVQMGVLTITAKSDELEYLGPQKKEKVLKKKSNAQNYAPKKDVKVELDLHGMRYVEAMEKLDKFVDDCLLSNLEFAYIIHGIGTMALKKGVEKYAKRNSQIKSFRSGGENEGGKGVTIIYFK